MILSYLDRAKKELQQYYDISCDATDLDNLDTVVKKRIICIDDFGRKYEYVIKDSKNMLAQMCLKDYFDDKYDSIFNPNSYKARPARHISHAMADMYRLVNLSKLYFCVKVNITDIKASKAFIKRKLYARSVHNKYLYKLIDGLGKSALDDYILRDTYDNIILSDLDDWLDSQWRVNPNIYKTRSYKTASGSVNYGNSYKKMRKTNLKEFYFIRYGREICIFTRDFSTASRIRFAVTDYISNHYHSVKFDTSIIDLNKKSLNFDIFRIKIRNGKAYSYVQKDVCAHIYRQLKGCVQKMGTAGHRLDRVIKDYNDKVNCYKSYCKTAMNVSVDFHDIHNNLRIAFHNLTNRYSHLSYEKINGSIRITKDKIKIEDIGDIRYCSPRCLKKN